MKHKQQIHIHSVIESIIKEHEYNKTIDKEYKLRHLSKDGSMIFSMTANGFTQTLKIKGIYNFKLVTLIKEKGKRIPISNILAYDKIEGSLLKYIRHEIYDKDTHDHLGGTFVDYRSID